MKTTPCEDDFYRIVGSCDRPARRFLAASTIHACWEKKLRSFRIRRRKTISYCLNVSIHINDDDYSDELLLEYCDSLGKHRTYIYTVYGVNLGQNFRQFWLGKASWKAAEIQVRLDLGGAMTGTRQVSNVWSIGPLVSLSPSWLSALILSPTYLWPFSFSVMPCNSFLVFSSILLSQCSLIIVLELTFLNYIMIYTKCLL